MIEWLANNALGLGSLLCAGLSYVFLLGQMKARFEASETDIHEVAEALREHVKIHAPSVETIAILAERTKRMEEDLRQHSASTRETRTELLAAVAELRKTADERLGKIQDALSRKGA